MTDEQKKLLDLLKEIDAICRRNNIVYYLAGGTCIGAIRHRGFIPWDDDMDIYMTRSNWEKFMEISKTDFPDGRKLMCQELDPTYTNMFGRYCDTTTTALHKHNMYPKKPEDDSCGAIVDILVLDPVPSDDPDFMFDYAKKLMLYSELVVDIYRYGWRWFLEPGRYAKKRIECLFKGRRHVRKKLYKDLFKYDEDQCDFYAMRWGGVPLLFKKEWFQKPVDMQFEDMTAMMPTMSNAYLTMHYGDNWMYIPSHGERDGHVAVFRMDIRYDDFRREYMPLMPKHRRFTNAVNGSLIKIYKMQTASQNNKRKIESLKKYGERVFENTCSTQKFSVQYFYELLEDGKVSEIRDVIGNYEDVQLSADFIGREDYANIQRFLTPILIDVPDDFFEFFVIYCIRTNKIAKGLRLIEIKEKKDGEVSERLKKYREYILEFRRAADYYDIGKYDESLKILKKLEPEVKDWDVLLKLELRLFLYKNTGNEDDAEDLLRTAEKKFGSDGEFIRYRIEFDRKKGKEIDPVEVLETGAHIHETTANGLIHLAVDDECRELIDDYFEKLESVMEDSRKTGSCIEAEKWIRIGKILYEETKREEYELCYLKAAFHSNYDLKKYPQNLSRVVYYMQEETDLKEEWTELYHETLLRHGYDEDSASKLSDLVFMSFEDIKTSADSALFNDDVDPGKLSVKAAYLYAAGRTEDAMNVYQSIISLADHQTDDKSFDFVRAEAEYKLEPYLRFLAGTDTCLDEEADETDIEEREDEIIE